MRLKDVDKRKLFMLVREASVMVPLNVNYDSETQLENITG